MQRPRPQTTALWLIAGAVLATWLWVTLPMALGTSTFYYRDVAENHLPVKAFGARYLRQGEIPTFNSSWGLGQPFRGNPASLAFYPGNLLYLVLPFWSAFNLHFCLHWLLAGLGMALLARRLGQSPAAALLAGVTYFGCGWMLTNLTFYNLITVAAWWPLVIACALVPGRRGIALGGLCCGLALLGGGPILATLGLVPLLMVMIEDRGWRRGVLAVGAVGVIGLAVALPQIVATARVLSFSVRGASTPDLIEIVAFTFQPIRLLELLVPTPFGWPAHPPPYGMWAWHWIERIPYYFSVYPGIVALWLAGIAARRRWPWAVLAAAGVLVAVLAGYAGSLLIQLAGGLFRYPEKFLFWLALAVPLLAGWGLDQLLSDERRHRLARWLGAAMLAGGLFFLVLRPWAMSQMQLQEPGQTLKTQTVGAQMALWAIALGLGGALLLASLALARRRGPLAAPLILALQVVALAQLWPLMAIDSTATFEEPADWLPGLEPGDQVLGGYILPRWTFLSNYAPDESPFAPMRSTPRQTLAPALGVFRGLGYPLAPNAEGLGSVLKYQLQRNLLLAKWPERVNWLRALGIEVAVFGSKPPDLVGLRPLELRDDGPDSYYIYAVEGAAPEVWWPRELQVASTLVGAVKALGTAADPVATLIVPGALGELDHDPDGSVKLISAAPDRVVFDVESGGGAVAWRRAFHPLFHARIVDGPEGAGDELPTFYADVFLTGISVPPGKYRVEVAAAGAAPEIAAGLLALVAALACLWIGRPSRGAPRAGAAPVTGAPVTGAPVMGTQAGAPRTGSDR